MNSCRYLKLREWSCKVISITAPSFLYYEDERRPLEAERALPRPARFFCERFSVGGTRRIKKLASPPCSSLAAMFGFVREKVSKNKIRYRDEQEGFDLDLTCILDFSIWVARPHALTHFSVLWPCNMTFLALSVRLSMLHVSSCILPPVSLIIAMLEPKNPKTNQLIISLNYIVQSSSIKQISRRVL